MANHTNPTPPPTVSDWKPSMHTMAQVALAIQHTKSWKPSSKATRPPATTSASASSPPSHTSASSNAASSPFASSAPSSRRQSWKTEDLKHECHMSGVADIGECPGFTEHEHCCGRGASSPAQAQDAKDAKADSSSH